MKDLTPKMQQAHDYAKEKHGDQQYGKDNKPYMYHLEGVANGAGAIFTVSYGYNSGHGYENLICAALLHDVVEDTDVTYCDIAEVFGGEVGWIVRDLTHEPKDDYLEYIFKVSKQKLPLIIKIADLSFNIAESQHELLEKHNGYCKQRMEKYMLARYILTQKLKGENYEKA